MPEGTFSLGVAHVFFVFFFLFCENKTTIYHDTLLSRAMEGMYFPPYIMGKEKILFIEHRY